VYFGGLYLIHDPGEWRIANQQLGYPFYIIPLLGVTHILGGVGFLIPNVPRLTEWVYAGLATWSGNGRRNAPAAAFMLVELDGFVPTFCGKRLRTVTCHAMGARVRIYAECSEPMESLWSLRLGEHLGSEQRSEACAMALKHIYRLTNLHFLGSRVTDCPDGSW
jgi:hypothetical protein